MSLWNDEQEKPIRHLRVIDLTVMLTGPYITRILSQYGADVVKVEKTPEGDPLRHLPGTHIFEVLNQGKKSVGVDLSKPEGSQFVQQMAAEADIFIENFRDGVMEKLGLGYADLSEANPDLLYVSLRGFSGKNAGRSGHDLNFIATSGVGEWFLESSAPNYSTFFGDTIGGVFMPLTQILMHVANPNRRGMHLVCNMDEGFRSLYLTRAYDAMRADHLEESEKEKFGAFHIFSGDEPHSRFYKCRDNQWISLQAVQQKHWEIFCEVVDKKEWLNRRSDTKLIEELEKLFGDAPASYWEALVGTKDCCLFRVIPWNEHMSFTQARPQLSSDPLSWMGLQPTAGLKPAPQLGADTFGVLHAMGIGNKEITDAISKGIVTQVPKK